MLIRKQRLHNEKYEMFNCIMLYQNLRPLNVKQVTSICEMLSRLSLMIPAALSNSRPRSRLDIFEKMTEILENHKQQGTMHCNEIVQ